MSEVIRACFQGVQAPKVIKDRLREANKQCYLNWQTEIKEKRFILSYVTENGAVKNATVPNPSARKVYGSLGFREVSSVNSVSQPVSQSVSPSLCLKACALAERRLNTTLLKTPEQCLAFK